MNEIYNLAQSSWLFANELSQIWVELLAIALLSAGGGVLIKLTYLAFKRKQNKLPQLATTKYEKNSLSANLAILQSPFRNTKNIFTARRFAVFFVAIVAVLFTLSSLKFNTPIKVDAAAVPNVTTSYPTTGNIGENINFTVTFSNPGTNPGFGPFIDIIVPSTGTDGAGIELDDGLTINSATYLGSNLVRFSLVFPETGLGCSLGLTPVNHPLAVDNTGAPLVICGKPGDTLEVIQLPFGSFVPSQPNAVVNIGANISNLADSGSPLAIQTRGGFRFGNDALNNFVTDPSLVGSFATSSLNPSVFSINKTYIGPESETATGPNFPRRYRITADIANGQTVTNLDLSDKLPPQAVFRSVISSSPAGATITSSPITTVPTNTPNNLLNLRFNSVTGGAGTADAEFIFEYYIPDRDASNNIIINHTSGDSVNVINDALGSGNWIPVDTRDPISIVTSDATTNDHTLAARSIAIQKSFANLTSPGNNKPGNTIEYTLNFQISDYFAFENVNISDVMSDGQTFDSTFTPTLSINELGATSTGNISNTNFTVNKSTGFLGATGLTTINFDISGELLSRGSDNQIRGGCSQSVNVSNCTTNNGPATASLVFRSTINDQYTDNYSSGDPSLSMGDTLSNNVTITGNVLNNGSFTPTGQSESNTSGVNFDITLGSVSKEVYAINGNTAFSNPVKVGPGDSITYKLSYNLSLTDTENFFFEDYLPLPVLSANGFSTTFDATVSATPPTAGSAKFGPGDTFYGISGIVPAINITPSENRIRFDYGGFQDPLNRVATAEILITLTASNEPFANGLSLTNQLRASSTNTFSAPQISDGIVAFELLMPDVSINKGVVATNNPNSVFTPTTSSPQVFNSPGSTTCTLANHRFNGNINSSNLATTPIESDLTGSDANDLITYAVTLENLGESPRGAFDIRVRDILPAGMQIPSGGLNLCVTRGDGTPVPFTAINGGDPVPLFGSGIELTDPSLLEGSLASYDPNTPTLGNNVIIISYDLQVQPNVLPATEILNDAELFYYTAAPGGIANFVPNNSTKAQASVITAAPTQTKTLTSTDQPLSTDPNVFVGEIATYTLTTNIPEGNINTAVITDNLDAGLALVDVVSITGSAGVSTSIPGGFSSVLSNTAVTNAGATINWNFGTISNTDTNNSVAENITIVYRAVVTNSGTNNRGTQLNNSAFLSYNNGNAQTLAPVFANNITILEPSLALSKANSPTTGDAGDLITYTLTLSHTGASNSPAFDTTISDVIPAGITYEPASLTFVSGVAPTSLVESGGTITGSWTQLNLGQTSQFTFQGRPSSGVFPGQAIVNTAVIRWTSLPGDVTTAQSTHSSISTERTGTSTDPGGATNDNTTSANSTFTVNNVATNKSISATSESFTGNVGGVERLAVGEIVRYRLATTIPEGTINNFRVRDNLPTGLQFLDDGTTRVGFSSNGGLSSSIVDFASCNQVGSSGTITPTCVIPSTQISGGAFGDGTDPIFNIGNITNTDNDANAEFIVIEMNALVLNVSGNQAFNQVTGAAITSTKTNNFTAIRFNPTTSADVNMLTSGNNSTQIAEPLIRNLSKTLITTPVDAGDPFTYQLTFSNTASGNNATNAYDIRLLDTLDNRLVVSGVNVVSSPIGTVVTDSSNLPSNIVDLGFSQLLPGGSVTVQISGTVITASGGGQTIPNTANLTYTSLPGSGTTSNPTGSNIPNLAAATSERNGTGSPSQNDFSSSSTVNFNLSQGSINKTVLGGNNYKIGEEVTFNLLASIPEGNNNNVRVRDTMPAGLEYISHSTITTAASSGGLLSQDFSATLPAPSFSQTGQQLDFSFGDLTLPGDNNVNNNSFIVQVVMRVVDTPANQNATNLINNASLTTFNTSTSADQTTVDLTPPSITLIVPVLNITKSFIPNAAAPNDTVTVQLSVQNTGGAIAEDVTIVDIVDKNNLIDSALVTTPSGFSGNIVSTPTTDTITYSGGNIPAGATVNFTFTAKLVATLSNAQIISNTANITQASTLSGTFGFERNFGPIPSTANLTVQTPDIVVSKTNNTSVVTTDQNLVYDITVTNSGLYLAENILVTETLPTYSTFNPTNSLPTIWNLVSGNYQTTISSLNPGQSVTLKFAVDVDSTIPSGVNNFANTVTAVDDGTHGNDPTPTNNTAVDTDTLDATPDIVVSKTNNTVLIEPAETLNYTITVSNNGNQDATGVAVVDTIPTLSSFVSASDGGSFASGQVTFPLFNLAAGATVTRTVSIQVNPNIPSSVDTITNTVTANDDGTNGTDPTPADNTATDTDNLNAAPDLTITKDDGLTTVTTGANLSYTLTITNNGDQDATGVVVSDILPSSTTYVSSSDGGFFGSGIVVFPAFSLASGSSVTRTVNVTVNSTAPSGLNNITNIANVIDDSSNGVDTNPSDNTDNDINILNAAPDLTITKTDNQTNTAPGQTLTYEINVTNQGNQGASGITVSETVPNNTTFVASGSSSWSCANGAVAGTSCTSNIANLPAGSSTNLTFTVLVQGTLPSGVDQIANTVSVQDNGLNGADPTPSNNTATDTDTLDAFPDLVITKTNNVLELEPGEAATYEIAVTNQGNQVATGVNITDTLPAYTSFISASNAGVENSGIVSWPTITLNPSQTVNYQVVISVADSIPSGIETITNTATAQDDGLNGADPTPANNTDTDTDNVIAVPELSINIDDLGITTSPDGLISYSIDYTNTGNQNATGVVASIAVPANTTFVASGSTTGWSCSDADPSPTICSFNIGNLNVLDTANLNFVVRVNPSLPSGVENILANISIADDGANGLEANLLNNVDSETTPVTASPDLTITKDDGLTTVTTGANLAYTLTITNNGNQDATGVLVTDTIPNSTNYVSSSDGGSFSSGVVSFPLFNLAAGDTVTRTVSLSVDSSVPAGVNNIVNSASVTDDGSNGVDTNLLDNTDTDTDVLVASPDLVVSKSDSGALAIAGANISYTITYSNNGSQDATGVVITETVPDHTTFVASGSTAGWSCSDGDPAGTSCTLSIGNLDSGDSGSAAFNVIINSTLPDSVEQLENTVSIADDGTNGPDENPTNNQALETTGVDAAPDLAITKVADQSSVSPEDTLSYTISYSNNGSQDATGVVITETVPDHTTFVASGSTAGWSCSDGDVSGTSCTLSIGNLDSGDSGSAVFNVRINPSLPSGIDITENTVSIADNGTNGPDENPTNNQETISTTLVAAPDLEITKTNNITNISLNDAFTYTLTINNIGNQDATGVVVTDTLPQYLTNVVISNGGSENSGVITWPAFNLAVGDSASFTVSAIFNPGSTIPAGLESITNSTQVTDDGTNGSDLNILNNTDTDTDLINGSPDLEITIDDGQTILNPLQQTIYNIVVNNNSIQDATGVVVTVPIPNGLTYYPSNSTAGWTCTATECTFPIGSLQGNQNQTLELAFVVDAQILTNSISVTATVADDGLGGIDPTPANNTDTDIDQMLGNPDLEITKTDFLGTISAGQNTEYSITITNIGNIIATGVTVTDTYDEHLNFISSDIAPASTNDTTREIVWNGLSINPGESITILAQFSIDSPVPAGKETVENVVEVVDDGVHGVDQDTSNNQSTDTDILDAAPDLVVTNQLISGSPYQGEVLTYLLTYSNIGNQDSTGAKISVIIPANTVYQESAGWVCDGIEAGSTCTYDIGDLNAGESPESVEFKVKIKNGISVLGAIVELAGNIYDDGNNGAEVTMLNNLDEVATPLPYADLILTKTVDKTVAKPQEILVYDFIYRNLGPDTATNISMEDILPIELQYISSSQDGLTFPVEVSTTADGRTRLRYSPPDLAPGVEKRIQVTTRIVKVPTTTLTNEASIWAREVDPDLSTNRSRISVVVEVDKQNQSQTPNISNLFRTGGATIGLSGILVLAGISLLIWSRSWAIERKN